MARKKQELALQLEIDSREEWDDLLSKDGLIVVDVYQSYGGSCKGLEPRFRTLNNILGDNKLRFAIAKADTIDALEDYRGKCEPCFLFFANKSLVASIRGANAPLIVRTIQNELNYEHRVLKGEVQRKSIKDPFLSPKKTPKKENEEVKHIIATHKDVTICVIKPALLEKKKKDEIVAKISMKGYEVIDHKELIMSVEQVKAFYHDKVNTPQFADILKDMTTNKSCVLAVARTDAALKALKEELKSDDPDSLAKMLETDEVGEIPSVDENDAAAKELAYFFPNLGSEREGKNIQRTLALIRPSAYKLHKDEILKRIEKNGFSIAFKKTVNLSKEQAAEFYAEHKGKPFFDDLVNEMSSGLLLVLCLAKENAINNWRTMLGPKEKESLKEAPNTLRSEFDISTLKINSLHGASTPEQAEKELKFFFPIEQTVAIIKPGLAPEQRQEIQKKIQESGFIVAAKKEQHLTKEIAQEIYKSASEKPYFNDLVNLMSSGETEILVLSRENAIEGWRDEIGPVDPKNAKQEKPDSLRAIFGVDVLKNAVHGASTKEQAEKEIKLFFGDLKFDAKENENN